MGDEVKGNPRDRELGDRVKKFEDVENDRAAPEGHPIVVRLDGRAFHTFVRGLQRPWDPGLRCLMQEAAMACAMDANALLVYTQSDEITLILRPSVPGESAFFGGRLQKIATVLASRATAVFNAFMARYLPSKVTWRAMDLPVFDGRAWAVPTEQDACDVIAWRELDARVNSVSMVAQHYFESPELHGKSTLAQKEMLRGVGVEFNEIPIDLRRGVYFQRVEKRRKMTALELEDLPPKHNARVNPDLEVVRSDWDLRDFQPFVLIQNQADVVFRGADPKLPDPVVVAEEPDQHH